MTAVLPATSLKFGTSGLRGLVDDLNGLPAYAYTAAFLDALAERGALKRGDSVFIGRDYRASSPAIAALCIRAIGARGYGAVDCGALPTPALALAAMTAGAPSIMVTGSHIPEDRNGLKFYRADGEIDKADEAAIAAHFARNGLDHMAETAPAARAPSADPLAAYRRRYLDFLPSGALSGLKVGVYEHSSVAREVLVEVLTALGADVRRYGQAATFIPVDTEAVRAEDKALALRWVAADRLDALVSTDGDADRPLIADETGHFLRGDLIGALTATFLGVTTIATPVTSNSQLEACGSFQRVARTRVGSPFVIAAVEAERAAGRTPVIGFEANGGVLLGADVTRGGRTLARLLTRDAMLPILCSLAAIGALGRPLSEIAAGFGFAHADSTRIEHVASERTGALLARLQDDAAFRAAYFDGVGGVAAVDATDGLRFALNSGATVHYRASGNAPEMRVYVETKAAQDVAGLLDWAFEAARSKLG